MEKEQSLLLRLGAKVKKGRKVALRIEHLFARGCPMDFACAISFNPQMLTKFILLSTYYVVSTVPSILIDCFKDEIKSGIGYYCYSQYMNEENEA